MKKILIASILNIGFITSAFSASLTCKDIVGVWRGNLGQYHNVALTIEDTGGHAKEDAEDASITFITSDDSYFFFSLFTGTCKQTPDGIAMNLDRNSYGVHANIDTHLISANEISITSFSFDAHGDSGFASGNLTRA